MSEKIYEGMFLLDTGKMTGDMNVTADQLIGLIQKHGGEVYTHRVWDDRKLAYAVKKQKKSSVFHDALQAKRSNNCNSGQRLGFGRICAPLHVFSYRAKVGE